MDKQNNDLMAMVESLMAKQSNDLMAIVKPLMAKVEALEVKKEEPKKEVVTKILLPEEVIASKLEAKKAKVAEKDVIKNDGKIEMREAHTFGKIGVMTLRNKSSLINYIHHITALGKLSYGTVKIQYKGSIGADGLLKENSKVVQKGEALTYDDIAKAWNVFHLIPSTSLVLYNYHTSDIIMMLSVI